MKNTHNTIISEQLLAGFSEQLAPYLSEVGVPEDVLFDPTVELPEGKFVELLEVAAKHGEPDLGLSMGSRAEPSHLGAIAHAMVNAPKVEEALNTLSEFIVTYSHFSEIKWHKTGRFIEISYRLTDPTILAKRQDAEFAIAAMVKFMSECAGTELTPERVEFEHEKPDSTRLHSQVFKCPLKFSAPINKLVFYRDVIDKYSAKADNRLFTILISHLKNQKKLRESDELYNQLSCQIAAQMHLGDVSIGQISKLMGISVRTLQRRLAENNLDFSQILNKIRHQLAMNYIADTRLSILKISQNLGYLETSSFTRAFKRWTGVTPKEYRQLQVNTIQLNK